jgi:hypothetical protein
VIDNSLQSVDLKDNAAVKSADVVNDTVVGGGLTNVDLRASSVGTSEVQDNSLTGPDVRDLSFQALTLKNGWVGNCASGGSPAIAKSVEGVVHFHGEMCRTSAVDNAFAVPTGFAPSHTERITVTLCGARTGQLEIGTNGEATVHTDPDDSNASTCDTSLAGASYTLPF